MKKAPSYIYSIIGISLVLFLLGTIGWLAINGRSLSRFFKEQIEVQVILHDNTRDEMSQQLETVLKKQPFVSDARIITKEEAAKQYVEEKGEDFRELLDFNPLYTSISLRLHSEYVNADSLKKIQQFVMQSNIVREVSYPNTVVDQMNSNFRKIGIVLGAIALILFIAVVIIIDNTVRLAMFSNRLLIKTMQMVGATRWFIARPFDSRAIVSGLISALIAVLGLIALIYFAGTQLPELNALRDYVSLAILIAGILVLGILISVLSTHRSVVKYLKLKLDDLY
ncbi:cell division protein FtsX [Taibaiella chishuiensis]|uniref:Cell division protein FtsX n=1 Tax=Taibaiella chishuiensis TaxID=1434707 RepID=A0A2P8D4B9_9BACT|nr:permease-like cell division protein FtsX [Taibaiella chishuiensis]PSK92068.1 cell division protein FtsX [Taibaiella chishuiensis]